MKLPRDVSGEHFVGVLCRRWQYRRIHQTGSHIIIETAEPSQQRIAVPNHDAIRVGTLNAILRAVADHKAVTREAIVSSL
jgi:predicted RNA binding protein YcfA (HicA-like mRNA interferase family)